MFAHNAITTRGGGTVPQLLCIEHVLERSREVAFVVPLDGEATLPLKTRDILCHTCKQALEQPRRVA